MATGRLFIKLSIASPGLEACAELSCITRPSISACSRGDRYATQTGARSTSYRGDRRAAQTAARNTGYRDAATRPQTGAHNTSCREVTATQPQRAARNTSYREVTATRPQTAARNTSYREVTATRPLKPPSRSPGITSCSSCPRQFPFIRIPSSG